MGPKRGWYETGQPSYEALMFNGVFHGTKREWHRNGQLAEEAEYELGFELRRSNWAADGNLIGKSELDKNDPGYKRLEKYREAYKVDLAEEEARQVEDRRQS